MRKLIVILFFINNLSILLTFWNPKNFFFWNQKTAKNQSFLKIEKMRFFHFFFWFLSTAFVSFSTYFPLANMYFYRFFMAFFPYLSGENTGVSGEEILLIVKMLKKTPWNPWKRLEFPAKIFEKMVNFW